jgi:hypothetical protein
LNQVISAANSIFANRASVKRLVEGHIAGLMAGAALLGAIPVAAQAGTFYGCVDKKEGAVRVVSASTACKTKEYRIQWNDAGPQGQTGSVGPQGPAGPAGPSLVWVDANGKTVGPAHGDQFVFAALPGFSVNLRVLVTTYGASPLFHYVSLGYRNQLFYTSPDCKGQAYIGVGVTNIIPGDERLVTLVNWPTGQSVIFVGRDEAPAIGTALSYVPDLSGTCVNTGDPGITGPAIPADPATFDLNALFPPPLHLRWQ